MLRAKASLRDKQKSSNFWPYEISLGAQKRKVASDDRSRYNRQVQGYIVL